MNSLEETVRIIKSKIKIEKVIGRIVLLRPTEKSDCLYGKCPFCEKAGEMLVSIKNQIYYCICCDDSGDVLGFIGKKFKAPPLMVIEIFAVCFEELNIQ